MAALKTKIVNGNATRLIVLGSFMLALILVGGARVVVHITDPTLNNDLHLAFEGLMAGFLGALAVYVHFDGNSLGLCHVRQSSARIRH